MTMNEDSLGLGLLGCTKRKFDDMTLALKKLDEPFQQLFHILK